MTSLHLTPGETANYNPAVRAHVRAEAAKRALSCGQRFAEIIDCNGRVRERLELTRRLPADTLRLVCAT